MRLITEGDAAYVFDLRTKPVYNQHLSAVQGTAQDQRDWITRYKAREDAGEEYYFIIERRDGTRCGTVRLYNIGADSFTWGSWILDHNKPHKAALESAVLVYEFAFDQLGVMAAKFDVRQDNENTIAFHVRFGAIETHRTDADIFFVYPQSRFQADRDCHMATLRGADR